MSIGCLIAVLSRTTSRQDRFKICMIMIAILSFQHQEDHIQRFIRSRESRNMQHFLLMNLRSNPSGVSHPHQCDIMITIETGNSDEFRSMCRVSRSVFSALLRELAPHLQDGRSRNRRQNLSAEMKLQHSSGIISCTAQHAHCLITTSLVTFEWKTVYKIASPGSPRRHSPHSDRDRAAAQGSAHAHGRAGAGVTVGAPSSRRRRRLRAGPHAGRRAAPQDCQRAACRPS